MTTIKKMDKGELFGIILEYSSLDVAHDNLDSVWTKIDRIVEYYGPDEELEVEGVIPKDLVDELEEMSDRIQTVSCKLLELMDDKELEIQLGLGYSPEEIERTKETVKSIVGAVVGVMAVDAILGNDDEDDEEGME